MPPRILTPREWGAQVDYFKWNDPFTPDDGVALHHGGSANYPAGRKPYNLANEVAQMRAWEDYHLRKGWRGIGYGFGVGQTGTILIGREFNTYGAHSGDRDGDGIANNAEEVPIIWIASGNHHQMSDEAAASIEYLRREIIEPRSPKATTLRGHQELKGIVTTCPGPHGMAYVEANRLLEDEMTPEQEQALDTLVAMFRSKPEDEPPWGAWFWDEYQAEWRGSPPGPLDPVTHIQLGFVWKRLEHGLEAILKAIDEGDTAGADRTARAMLAAIHDATEAAG